MLFMILKIAKHKLVMDCLQDKNLSMFVSEPNRAPERGKEGERGSSGEGKYWVGGVLFTLHARLK